MGLQSSGEFQTTCLMPSEHSRAHKLSQPSTCPLHCPCKNWVVQECTWRGVPGQGPFHHFSFLPSHRHRSLLEEDADLQISVCTEEAALPGESWGPLPQSSASNRHSPSLTGADARPRKLPAPGCPAQHRGTRRCQTAGLLPAAGGCFSRWCSAPW